MLHGTETESPGKGSCLCRHVQSTEQRTAEARVAGKISTLADLVTDGVINVEQAAKKMGMTVEQFKEAVEALKVTA